MSALDFRDLGAIQKLSGKIREITIEVGKCRLVITDDMAFWTSYSFEAIDDGLGINMFIGHKCITKAVDYYIKVIGEGNGKA